MEVIFYTITCLVWMFSGEVINTKHLGRKVLFVDIMGSDGTVVEILARKKYIYFDILKLGGGGGDKHVLTVTAEGWGDEHD